MKTQIIQLEPHDDATSTRDKMGWAKAARILLVWPGRGKILARRLDLELLERRAEELGARLALVTHDPDVRFHARALGLPVFKSQRRAQKGRWRAPKETGLAIQRFHDWRALRQEVLAERSRPGAPLALRLGAFVIATLAVLGLAAVLLPGAAIAYEPRSQPQEIILGVTADPNAEGVDASGVIPAYRQTVVVEGRASAPATGTVSSPAQAATGVVVFTNLTNEPVSIPAGTVVTGRSSGTPRFATLRPVEVAAGPGQTVDAAVKAVDPGVSGNRPAGSLQAIEDPVGARVSVDNPEPTRGGSDRRDSAPTQADRKALREQLAATLAQTALEELRRGLAPGDVLVEDSLAVSQALEEQFDPAGSEPADHLTLALRLEYSALAAAGADLQALAAAALDAGLPEGYRPAAGSLETNALAAPVMGEDGTARWELSARRSLQAVIPAEAVARLAAGSTPAQAAEKLSDGLPLAGPPQIRLSPAWWPRLPLLPFRIQTVKAGG